jgi:hypothetical protein
LLESLSLIFAACWRSWAASKGERQRHTTVDRRSRHRSWRFRFASRLLLGLRKERRKPGRFASCLWFVDRFLGLFSERSIQTSIRSKRHEELIRSSLNRWGRLHRGLFSLDDGFSCLDIRGFTRSSRDSSLGLLHLFHPLLEILLRVSFGMLLERFI